MRKKIIPKKDFYTINLKEGYKIRHRPSELEVISYGTVIGNRRFNYGDIWDWEGSLVEQEAWKQMKEKLSEHYHCEVVIT